MDDNNFSSGNDPRTSSIRMMPHESPSASEWEKLQSAELLAPESAQELRRIEDKARFLTTIQTYEDKILERDQALEDAFAAREKQVLQMDDAVRKYESRIREQQKGFETELMAARNSTADAEIRASIEATNSKRLSHALDVTRHAHDLEVAARKSIAEELAEAVKQNQELKAKIEQMKVEAGAKQGETKEEGEEYQGEFSKKLGSWLSTLREANTDMAEEKTNEEASQKTNDSWQIFWEALADRNKDEQQETPVYCQYSPARGDRLDKEQVSTGAVPTRSTEVFYMDADDPFEVFNKSDHFEAF